MLAEFPFMSSFFIINITGQWPSGYTQFEICKASEYISSQTIESCAVEINLQNIYLFC